MKNPADHPIHDLLSARWSPYAIDPDRTVSPDDLHALFEAARWTMSSYNAQPWRYIVGVKDRSPEVWQKVFECLVEGNQPWAKNAPVLAIGLTSTVFDHNGQPNKAAHHDLGAASASLTFEATARGLVVHQMIGIEPEKVREVFGIADTIEPLTALAIGYAGQSDVVEQTYADRDARPRERTALTDIILHGAL
ncbi:MAG: nitroreductase family protein [Pseudomonadota bacterium]